MNNSRPKTLIICFALHAVFCYSPLVSAEQASSENPNQSPPGADQIDQWIVQLDDDRYLVRERATSSLLDSGDAALDALLEVANADRPEPADRAVWILRRLGQAADNDLAIAALERLVEVRDRPRLVENAESQLAERAIVACQQRLAPLGAEVALKYEPVEVGNVVPILEVLLGPQWKGSIEDLQPVARLRQQFHFRLIGAPIDDAVVKLFEKRDKLAHLQLHNTRVTPDAIDDLKRRHPDVIVYMRNNALLGISAQNHAAGALVQHVEAGSAAANAGILPGDIITSLDGQPLPDFDRLTVRIAQHQPGEAIDVEILRGNDPIKLTAILGSWADKR